MDLLQADDYRRLLTVIEAAGRHAGTSAFRSSVLDALDESFGYRGSAIFIAGAPVPFGPRDAALLTALRPHLQFYLRRTLPEPRPVVGLSQRELDIARLVAAGRRNRDVARDLGIREDTVKKHVSRAMAKLQLRSRTQLALALGQPPSDSTFVQ